MNCLKPKFVGYFLGRESDTLKCKIMKPKKGIDYMVSLAVNPQACEFYVPCGKCILCEAKKKRDMTTRIIHETKKAGISCFITLTYDNEHLPKDNNLVKSDLQKFLKRFRFHLSPKKIRYFAVGEYGKNKSRPHYHIIIFGYFPDDAYAFKWRKNYIVYRSPFIEKCWTLGFSTVGYVNESVAYYCAQYVQKKRDKRFYSVPEFWVASKMQGGIGYKFLDDNIDDIVNLNSCVLRSSKGFYQVPIPFYYINRIKDKHFEHYRKLVDTWSNFDFSCMEVKPYKELVSKASALEKRNKEKENKKEIHNNEKENVYNS